MKRIIAIFACVVILCSCLVIPAFAQSINGLDFSNQPIPQYYATSASDVVNNGFNVQSNRYTCASSDDVYLFTTTNYALVFASYSSGVSIYFAYGTSNWYTYNLTNFDSTTQFYYWSGNLINTVPSSVPSYSNVSSGLLDLGTWIEDNPIVPPISVNSLDVPAGNVAYIKTNGTQILDLTTTFVQYSQLFSDSWANITQKVTWSNSLPVGTVTFPLAGMSSLAWTKTGYTNILGQTQNASASYQSVADQYFVIYNPLYQQYGQGDNYDMNGTIHVSGEMTEVKVYPLSGSVVTGQGLVSNSESDYSDYYQLQDDGNGGIEWVDQSGNVSSGPQTGGTSLLPQEATIQTLAAQILQIITKVGQSIANIFNVGHQAIVTLVGHASEFVSHFQSLYTWLPADIFAVLSSAIILAITIGIIKVFI